MKEYILKSALVKEIEKIEEALKNACEPNPFGNIEECMTAAEIEALNEVKAIINTLEVSNDTFIKKACDYLSYHLDTSKIDVNYKFDFIEEFRKYMKGE